MLWLLLALIVLGIISLPYLVEVLRKPMDAAARSAAPGMFARLSRGQTHYQWLGAARGPVAVCVHGLTTPSYVWGPVAERLGALGFRVLVYDLYGRGFSDRPKGPQDSAFFVAQLADLLENQGIEDDVTLMGYSMGGAIVTAFAAIYPEKLRQIVLIAPAGMGHDLGPVARVVRDRGALGTWLALAFYPRSFRKALNAERDQPGAIEGLVERQLDELRYRGFVPSVIASVRGMLSENLSADHVGISRENIPVLAIWAREDHVIPIGGMGKLAEWNRVARHEVIEGAGHGLTYTHADEVLHAMRDLMRD